MMRTELRASISKAIAAHKQWIHGLSEALARQELSPAMKHAGYDDMCEFGIWLYGLDESIKVTQSFRLVKDLHYRFHQEAELVVEAALGGDFAGARLLSDGPFFKTSEELIAAMESWKGRL